jgi:predicted TIM-barrel fold metal-dependent hydrolase
MVQGSKHLVHGRRRHRRCGGLAEYARRTYRRQRQSACFGAPLQRILGRTGSFKTGAVWRLRLSTLAGCRCFLEELSYAIDVLRLDGFVLFTNSNGVYLGDPVLEPVFEELERRKTVVYVHPNPSPDAVSHLLGLPDNLLDFPTDTNRAVAQMHYTNRFARTPSVKYIFSHAGGSIPYLAARFAIIDEMGFIAGGEQRGAASDMFRRIFWDTALAASDPVLRMLRDVAGINQVLYGTDFPYLRRDLAVRSKQRILLSTELNDSERHAILGGNASRLLLRDSVLHEL